MKPKWEEWWRRGTFWRFGWIVYDFPRWRVGKSVWTISISLGRISFWFRHRTGRLEKPAPFRYWRNQMSVLRTYLLICDSCGVEYPNDEATSKKQTREDAPLGWKVGMKATLDNPSLYDIRTDLCPDCVYWKKKYKEDHAS